MIVKSGNHYLVKTEDGSRTLGTHPTRAAAERQLAAIEASKHARQGKKKKTMRIG